MTSKTTKSFKGELKLQRTKRFNWERSLADGRSRFAKRMKLLKILADNTMQNISTAPTFNLFDDHEPLLDRHRSAGGHIGHE